MDKETAIRLGAKLPASCYARHPSDESPIYIMFGMRGYYPIEREIDVDAENERFGVTPAQVEAMLVGSMFGWDVPGADPDKYT